MTVVYPLTNQKEYGELRYSLRSLEKFMAGSFDVVIIGDKLPNWITNVTLINISDIPNKKQLSIKQKIIAALEIHDEVLCMADDIYLLQETDSFPNYYSGMLKGYAESGAKQLLDQLEAMGKPTKKFDIHHPIIYRNNFKEISEKFTDNVIIKSMYCNYLEIEGVATKDCKPSKEMKTDRLLEFMHGKRFLSTGAFSFKSAMIVLNELFPFKSKFEV